MAKRFTFVFYHWLLIAILTLVYGSPVHAEDPRHAELRQLRESVFKAYEARDIDALLQHVHENVIVTWQNGEQNHGRDELRSFYDLMMRGDPPIVSDVKSELIVHQLATLYDPNTAIACGALKDQFKLTSGLNFRLDSQWSATLVKEADSWKIASFHVSSNLFDNPLLNAAKKSLWVAGGIAAVVGILLGFLVGRRRRSTVAK